MTRFSGIALAITALFVTFWLAALPTRATASSACGDTTPVVLSPPNHQLVHFDLATVTGLTPSSILITYITSDEPIGRDPFDVKIDNSESFDVRSERNGNGDGRIYRVHYQVLTTSCTFEVQVPISPQSTAIDSGTVVTVVP